MPLNRIECPSCGAGLKSVAGFAVGQKVRCPKCQVPFAVEEPADADDDVAPPPPPKPAARPPAVPAKKPVKAVAAVVDDDDDDDDRPRKKKRPARDEDDDRPRKKKKKKGGGYKTSPVRFLILGVLLVALGVLGYMLYDKKQKEKADAAKPAPAEVDPDADLAKPIKLDGKGKTPAPPAKKSSTARPPVPVPVPVPATAAAPNAGDLQFVAAALINYAEQNDRLPGPAIRGGGKPLLSWRVALLPYIKQDPLYRQFKLDEPWDSPHNKPLAAQIPRPYQTPGAAAGSTAVKLVVGAGSPFAPGRRLGLDQITDGRANTLLFVEAGPPVEWTRPDDIPFDPAGPAPDLGPPGGGDRTTVAMCDGSVRRLRLKGRPAAEVRSLVTAAGGEPAVNLNQ